MEKYLKVYKTRWDLDNIFVEYFQQFNYKKYLQLYEKEFQKVLNLTKFSFKDKPESIVENIKKFLFAYVEFLEVYADGGPGFAYLWLKYKLNQDDEKLQKEYKQAEFSLIRLSAQLEPFLLKLSKLPKKLQNLLLQDKSIKSYKYWLKILFLRSKYSLQSKTEVLLTKLHQPLYSNWTTLTEQVLVKSVVNIRINKISKTLLLQKLPFLSQESLNKSCVKVPFTSLRNFYTLSANNHSIVTYIDRKSLGLSSKYADFATTELNSISQVKGILLKERGYKSFYEALAVKDEVSEKAIKSLQEVVTRNFNLSRNYYKCFSKITGIKLHYGLRSLDLRSTDLAKLKIIRRGLYDYNVFKNKSAKVLPEISYEQAVKLLSKILHKVSSVSYKFLANMANGHIDVYPKLGKTGGAFSVSFSKKAPIFILLNWGNSFSNLFTLAHEFGHSLHSYLSNKYQLSLYNDYSLAIAEFASTFLENLVMFELVQNFDSYHCFLGDLTDSQLLLIKIILRFNFIKDSIATAFRQIALFNFEMELHKKVLELGYVGQEDINSLFVKHMSSYLGPAVKFKKYHKYGWIAWHHLRRPFYVYTYAFGFLSALSLLQDYKSTNVLSQKQEIFNKYIEILKAGSSDSVVNIFKKQGLNIESKDFWENSINFIKEHIDMLCI